MGGSSEEVLAFGRGILVVIDYIDDNGQLMDEFVRLSWFTGVRVARELVHHASQDTLCNPDVTVDDPYDLSWGLSISPADVSYFRVRSQFVDPAIGAVQSRVLVLDQDLRIVGGKVADELLEDRV